MEYGIALGSNIGDRFSYIEKALSLINNIAGYDIVAQSSLYETVPVDVPTEYVDRLFLNSVIAVEVECATAEEVLFNLNEIEFALGRKRGIVRNVPRTIDLDIIYAGNIEINTKLLTVPHPRWSERAFVVVPLAEIRPDLIIGNMKVTVNDVLSGLSDRDTVVKVKK